MLQVTEESAKAVQEVAKTTGKALDVVQSTGEFFAPHVDGVIELVTSMITDRLKYMRGVNLIRLRQKFNEQLQANGGIKSIQRLPMNFVADVLEQGAMEEDDELQDIWVRLLANTTDASSQVEPRKSYISIIKDLSTLDAMILEQLYSVDQDKDNKAIVTYELPHCAYTAGNIDPDKVPMPSEEIQVSLANLERLGLISYGASWGGGEVFHFVNQCTAGKAFMKAIKRRHV